jgi:hypothetical protein
MQRIRSNHTAGVRKLKALLKGALLFAPLILSATDFYVSPSGTAAGSGTQSNPWSLTTALAQPSAVRAGDTIWVRGGTYSGAFYGILTGTASAPIVVRNYPGERPILIGTTGEGGIALAIGGAYAWYWGLEVMNNPVNRSSSATGSDGLNGWGVVITGPYTKLINCIVHDTDEGISSWVQAAGSELTGNIVYNNGWIAPDRGHGHGVYVQNQGDTKKMLDNIVFNQYNHGFHAYTQTGYLNNLYLAGNTSFNNGILEGSFERNILVGGYVVAQNPTVIDNYTYFTPSSSSGENNLGYGGSCANAIVNNNYFTGGLALHLSNCAVSSVTGNTLYDTLGSSARYSGNTYYTSGNPPAGTRVFIRPNRYETGRANITIFNWARTSTVSVDLSSFLSAGTSYEIRDAENFNGSPVLSGTYNGGSVSLPMTGLTVAAPLGTTVRAAHTGPEFGVFVVLPTSAATTPASTVDTTAPSVSIAAPTAGQTVTGTLTVSASASDNTGVAGVQFRLDGANLGTESLTSPYSLTWNSSTVSNGVHTLAAVARDAAGNTTTSAAVAITVSNTTAVPSSTATVAFSGTDDATQGNWSGTYGGDGYTIANNAASLPSYAQVGTTGSTWTWAASTADTRALRKPGASDRIASAWYNTGSFTIDLNVTGGVTRKVALYLLDWDNNYRAETIDILDASSGAVLDTRSASNFTQGEYLVWSIAGHVTIRVTKTGSGSNGVVSGLFFGSGTASTTASGTGATFVQTDTATQGSWKAAYGSAGYAIAGDSTNMPSYATWTVAQPVWAWASSSSDVRALQKSGSSDRLAATWYASSFSMDLNLTDGLTHTVALYAVDWDSNGRTETVELLDSSTGTVLDTRTLTAFTGGQYLVWNLSGHIVFRIAKTSGPNAVVSGIFIGGAASGTSTSSGSTSSSASSPSSAAASPAGYWSFNTADIAGQVALDRSGNNLSATIDAAAATAGQVGQALAFNGNASSVLVTGTPLTQLTANLTLAAWINTKNTSRTEVLLSKYDAAGTEAGYLLKVTPSGTVALRLGGNTWQSGTREAADATPVNDGRWHHVAVVISLGQDVKFYVDGVLRSTQASAAQSGTSDAQFEIGAAASNYYGAPFTGSIDEVKFYRQALTDAQVAAVFAGN